MNYAKKIEDASVLYSCCSGYNFYFPANRRPCEVFGKNKNIIQHVKTEEFFYVTEFPDDLNNDIELNYWVELIRKPVDLKHYIWPVDIITLDEQPKGIKYALVFPIRNLPVFETITSLLSNDMQIGWNMPWVKRFTSNLLDAWCNFNNSKYAYHEFSDSNMFYQKENYNVMFDFSFSTQRVDRLFSTRHVNKMRVTPDYADSYYYMDSRKSLMDLASDYYSIAVILFKLLVGRLPYQGKVMEHEPNANELEHKSWMRIYHKNTYFIFDEKDNTNHIGGETGFAKDELFVDRWNKLPQHIRNMFHNVFQTANVMRSTDDLIFYSPQEWKEALYGEVQEVSLFYRDTAQPAVPTVQEKSMQKNEPNETEAQPFDTTADTLPELEPPTLSEVLEPVSEFGEDKKEKLDELVGVLKSKATATGFHDVILTKTPQLEKIIAIKVIREITGLGLVAAKELADNPPSPIVQGISEELATKIQAELALINVESRLSSNTKHNDQLESEIVARMQD